MAGIIKAIALHFFSQRRGTLKEIAQYLSSAFNICWNHLSGVFFQVLPWAVERDTTSDKIEDSR
jgi:hypothetical protein